ncbi:MAG: FAD-binding oxidoreductase [Bdellovibrionales bacterium]|nr:FAD-binding oxidoreductase [Bdellovibrionales bacterium]
MATSYWLDRSSDHKAKTFDILIVGGGITGASTAFWLKKEDPNLKIAILEKSRLAFGASGRNAGFITCGSVEHFNRMVSKHGEAQALEIWKFAETNMSLLKEHIIENEKSLEFEQRGAYSLAAESAEFNELKSVAQLMNRLNIGNEVLGSDQVEKRLGAFGFEGGIRYLKDGAINPYKLVKKIFDKSGCEFFDQTEVFAIESSTAGDRIVKTDNGVFHASIVVLCTNGYSGNLSSYFKDKIYPTRGQIMMVEPVEPFMDGPCYANFYLDYFRQLADGSLLIGGFRQLEKETEVGYSDHITDVIQSALHDFVQKHLPRFKDKKITHRWAGIMGFSQDGEPMIGALPEDNQVFFCGGFTGHGIGLAFHSGKCLSDLIFGHPIPEWISARRFP